MVSKPKYIQSISKLSHTNARLKEQVSGRLVHYWREEMRGGKSKICAVFLDGDTFQDVLTGEAVPIAMPVRGNVPNRPSNALASKVAPPSWPNAATAAIAYAPGASCR